MISSFTVNYPEYWKSTSTDQKTKKKSSKKPDSKKTDVKKSKKASAIKGKMEEETEAAPAVEAEIKGIFH